MKTALRYAVFFSLITGIFPVSLRAQMWQQSSNENNPAVFARINRGIELYGDGQWGNAIIELRRAQQENIGAEARAEAQFWIAMAAFAAGDYEEAIHNFDEIGKIDPLNIRCTEVAYHKGRALYYLKRYEEAIRLFNVYIDSIRVDGRRINGVRARGWDDNALYADADGDYNRKASAIYWMGECFYSLGDMTRSEELHNIVVKEYPKSHKFESAANRLALIKQKKIEGALLDILKTAPSETPGPAAAIAQPKTTEEAILEYQKRIAPYLINEAYKEQVYGGAPVAENRAQAAAPRKAAPYQSDNKAENKTDAVMRLLSIKTTALEIMDRLVSVMNANEIIEDERW
jgi:tetratricopeptide (TPR) repeat protein